MTPLHIGFIGTGRIARAIIAGLAPEASTIICGYDRENAAIEAVSRDLGVTPCSSISEVAARSRIIILAVKPYQVGEVLDELRSSLDAGHLLVSVAAGISSEFIRSRALEQSKVIRAMPNTPAFVGKGMTAVCRGRMAGNEEEAIAVRLFSAIGRVAVIDESQMDAATALSGSGPAYMFHLLADLAEGGRACGLGADEALILAAQTMAGAAAMVLEGGKEPEELKRQVTTPGGTTEAGLKVMDERGVRQIMIDAVAAAAARSRELMQ